MTARYEIREYVASDAARSYGITDPLYVVWDLQENKRVPFANYRNRMHAERRIKRLEAR